VDHLIKALAAAQRVGLGARRSQGFGQFVITEFRYVGSVKKLLNEDMLDEVLNVADGRDGGAGEAVVEPAK
jgi:CRISPR/Cas system CSM-associated protein Csm4 (group 5 of RAMP superfamily)